MQFSSGIIDLFFARSCSSISDAMEVQSGAVVAEANLEDVKRGGVVLDNGASQLHRNVLTSMMDRVCSLFAALWQRIVSGWQHWKSGGGGLPEWLTLLKA